ncbi:CAP domain-containing protein [Silvimonas iriomotensis]|uniref:CAP domain-containing protein n=1 Tax=Silvimonas iriomotensis TaxID=449662 RepID=UPI001668CFC1|nr:CAP domain-containing protein [Silvimonas iriomotensis]
MNLPSMRTGCRLPALVGLCGLLVACGGGDGSGDPASNANTAAPTSTVASGTAFAPIDTSNRAEVMTHYNNDFLSLQATPFSWTGNVSQCNAGDTPLAYKNAVVRLVNYYRAMAGLPGNVTLSLDLSAQAQQAALMMDANNTLDHNPPASWACYTTAGATAAGSSDLSLGTPWLNQGIGGIRLYVTDVGITTLGHRRWVLYSRLAVVGSGDTPRADALWVVGNDGPAYTPANGIAWPPPGYVPRDEHIFEPASMQWSFSYPDADFSAATVSMTDDAGNAVAVSGVGELDRGYADDTLGWTINGSSWDRNPNDTRLNVTINHVMIGGVDRSFSYTVTFVSP